MNKAINYPWTRYWVPRDKGCTLDGAYLADPESEYAWADANQAVSLPSLRDKPVLVLLGEAGMGKSRALRQEFEALDAAPPANTHFLILNLNCYGAGNQAQLAADLFESMEFAAYRDGAYLFVFLDSLDEGRNHMPGLDTWLADQLRRKVTDPARFQLRIASRIAGWSASLETAVGEKWRAQNEGVAVYEICPLRRTDVVQAANIEGFPAEVFLEEVRNKEIEALAIDHIADLRRRLLEHLQTIGTWAAVHAVERVAQRLPDREWLKYACQRARAQAMDNQWQAPSWEELAQLLDDPNCRLIHTDVDLTQVVLESLARLQQSLRGETPLAPFLWEEDSQKPKSEGRLSDFVKYHLSSDLNRRGVLINREVEIKNWPGNGRGESLDLLIQAATPKGGPVATVVVEVKRCSNDGLDTAMETQLRDQYLIDSRYRHGIYLVGWYGPPEKRKSCNKTLDNLRSQLDEQARQLSKNSLHIHAVTLDLSYPVKPHPDTAEPI